MDMSLKLELCDIHFFHVMDAIFDFIPKTMFTNISRITTMSGMLIKHILNTKI